MTKVKILLAATLLVSVFSCTKSNEPMAPQESKTYKGTYGIKVVMYTAAGMGAPNAKVNVALSADSLKNGQYFLNGTTDSLGYILFENIDFGNVTQLQIYCNANFKWNSEIFAGERNANIYKDRIINEMIIVQPVEEK